MELARLIEHLSDPRAYPDTTCQVEVHQTHISVVFVTDAFAYKIKKPVALEFLDYSTLEKRRHWCEEEVRLNRRLATRIYLGVVPIVERRSGRSRRGRPARSSSGRSRCTGSPPKRAWLSAVERDDLSREAVESLARRIADFHRHAERAASIARFGRFDIVARNARDNFEQSTVAGGDDREPGGLRPAADADRGSTGAASCSHRGPSRSRRAVRWARRHPAGSCLLLSGSCPPDDLAIVDCIEFNVRFRAADPMADMAFLVMDLIRHGRRDLAQWFRDAYLRTPATKRGAAWCRSTWLIGRRCGPRSTASRRRPRALRERAGQGAKRCACPVDAGPWLARGIPAGAPAWSWSEDYPVPANPHSPSELASRAGFEVIRSDEIRKELARASGAV